jgi:hypothetical protein
MLNIDYLQSLFRTLYPDCKGGAAWDAWVSETLEKPLDYSSGLFDDLTSLEMLRLERALGLRFKEVYDSHRGEYEVKAVMYG